MMELENGMVIGALPYNQSDAPAQTIKCPWCKRAVDGDEYMIEYSGEWICTDCLNAEIEKARGTALEWENKRNWFINNFEKHFENRGQQEK